MPAPCPLAPSPASAARKVIPLFFQRLRNLSWTLMRLSTAPPCRRPSPAVIRDRESRFLVRRVFFPIPYHGEGCALVYARFFNILSVHMLIRGSLIQSGSRSRLSCRYPGLLTLPVTSLWAGSHASPHPRFSTASRPVWRVVPRTQLHAFFSPLVAPKFQMVDFTTSQRRSHL